MKIFIYALCDPITFEVRYIGKTDNPYRRYCQHISKRHLNRKRKRQTYKICWIKSLIAKSLLPVQQILEICNEDNWEEKEKDWIKFYKQIGCNLTNGTDGGIVGFECSHKNRIGKKLSAEWKSKISKTLKGRKLSETHKQNISKNHARRGKLGKDCPIYGRQRSDETKRKMSESQKLRDPKTRKTWVNKHHHTDETKLKISRTEKNTKQKVKDNICLL